MIKQFFAKNGIGINARAGMIEEDLAAAEYIIKCISFDTLDVASCLFDEKKLCSGNNILAPAMARLICKKKIKFSSIRSLSSTGKLLAQTLSETASLDQMSQQTLIVDYLSPSLEKLSLISQEQEITDVVVLIDLMKYTSSELIPIGINLYPVYQANWIIFYCFKKGLIDAQKFIKIVNCLWPL